VSLVTVFANHASFYETASVFLFGLLNDVSTWAICYAVILPVGWMMSLFSQSFANGFLVCFSVAFITIEGLLILYYEITDTLLTYQIFTGVSAEQIELTSKIYGFDTSQFFFILPFFIILGWIFWRLKNRFASTISSSILAGLFLAALILNIVLKNDRSGFSGDILNERSQSKIRFFVNSFFDYSAEQERILNAVIQDELLHFYALNERVVNPVYFEYPFYSNKPLKNPLGSFFVKKDTAPNVVIIICESLGRQFSGPDARLGSFTPFLDSLAEKGLYWTNFLANAERTFGALPNVLAGLPEGDKGFMSLRSSAPDHLSLPLLLKEQCGYQTAFFCGAIKSFDYMDEYLMSQKFDWIKSKPDFKQNQSKSPVTDHWGNQKNFNWGAEDEVVFNQSFDFMQHEFDSQRPYCNVYLTTSFHEPFNYSNKNYFQMLAQKEILKKPKEDGALLLKELETFAALMYMDHALKSFFDTYKNRPEFENTIFIICGDHSIKFLTQDSRLEKFHVPLLIYSPLISKAQKIRGLSCHKDISPALQGLLRENFNLNLPDQSFSQSDFLSTSDSFVALNSGYPLMYADRQMNTFVWNDILYMDGKLFRLSDKLKLVEFPDVELQSRMANRLDNYKVLNHYVCKEKKIIPDSVYSRYSVVQYPIYSRFDFEKNRPESIPLIGKNFISDEIAYSGLHSLTNHGEYYLNLLKNFKADVNRHMRLIVRFMIHVPEGDYPAAVVYRKWNKDQEESKTYFINGENITETDDPEWEMVEISHWFESKKIKEGQQQLGLFLFKTDGQSYFIDDLKIELRSY
jgi:phosphoglycerol transferase MdoB-like AlkP superfamily enzyme